MSQSFAESIRLEITPVAAVRPKVTRWNTYYPGRYGDYLPELREMIRHRWAAPQKNGPCSLVVVFDMPRPKSHYGTGRNKDKVKDSAPEYPHQDVDNLLKGVMDAASGVVYEDDKWVMSVLATKRYGEPGITLIVDDYGM